jgi:hypothetical protein
VTATFRRRVMRIEAEPRRLSICISTIVLVSASLALGDQNSKRDAAGKNVPQWQQLLEEANLISHNFTPEERASFLVDASRAAFRDPDLCKTFSLELFAIASTKLEPGHYRAATQKNSLVALSKVDPEQAGALFTKQDTPDMWNMPVLLEDFRAFGARTIFPELYAKEGMPAVPTIQSMANWVGSTGEYPYRAISQIIGKIPAGRSETANALVADAIRFFGVDRHFLDQNKEFTDFILSVQQNARPDLLRQAIAADLDALDREAKDDKAPRHTIEATSKGSTTRFTSEPQYLAYRLLPVIQSLDPDWAAQVKKKYTVLANLPQLPPGTTTTMVGAVTFPDQQAGPSETAQALDENRLMQAERLVGQDPKAAAQAALQISDPNLRAIALTTIAPAYMTVDARQAKSWTTESSDLLRRLPPDETRLRLMISLAEARATEGDTEAALDLMGKSFDLGEELFAQYMRTNPGEMSYTATGSDELIDLATKTAPKPALRSSVLARVRALREDTLKVRLLVAIAQGAAVSGTG